MNTIKVIFTLAFLITTNVFGQFIVTLNGKSVKANDEYALKDVQSLNVSFKKPAKIPEYTSGRTSLYINLKRPDGELVNQWSYVVDGYKASNNFLYPTTAVDYIVWSTTTKSDLTAYNYSSIFKVFGYAYGNINYRKLTVSIHLTFEEMISYDKYGKAQILLDPFIFSLDVWSKSNNIDLGLLQAKYTYNESSEYQELEESSGAINGLTEDKFYTIKFKSFNTSVRTMSTNGKSQDDALNELKANFEGYLKYNANRCNGKKILKDIPQPDDTKDWDKLTNLGPNSVLADLDQKNNTNFSSVKILEPVTIGSFTGYKYQALRHTHECTSSSVIIATVEGPADPKKRSLRGGNIIYFLKHPKDASKIIVINHISTNTNMTSANDLSPIKTQIEQFLSALSF